MKLLISADMEGIAGITHSQQCLRGTGEFPQSCELMSDEVRAACEAAFESGATSVTVNDSHGDMRNIIHDRLPPQVRLIQGNLKRLSMVEGLEGTFDALAFVGYHAGAATLNGILDHTYFGRVVHRLLLNGETCSESRLNSAVAGTFGVPAIFISGDQSACADAKKFLPWIQPCEVKHAVGRTAACSLSPAEARSAIAREIKTALESYRAGQCKPYVVEPPIILDLELMNSAQADIASLLPGSERLDACTVRYSANDVVTVFQGFRVMITLAGTL